MKLVRITLAATQLEPTVAFYDAVFDARLRKLEGLPMYLGSMLGHELLICDNRIASVDARQNRHQFRIAASDLAAVQTKAESAGGRVINRGSQNGREVIGVQDPDGNTYEFIQA